MLILFFRFSSIFILSDGFGQIGRTHRWHVGVASGAPRHVRGTLGTHGGKAGTLGARPRPPAPLPGTLDFLRFSTSGATRIKLAP